MATRTETVEAAASNYIQTTGDTLNHSTMDVFNVGFSPAKFHGVLRFNLPALNAGETLADAKLQLVTKVAASDAASSEWLRCTRNATDSPPGADFTVMTWLIWKASTNWTTSGGDYVSADKVSFLLPTSTGAVEYGGFRALANDAYNNRGSELLIIGKRVVESGINAFATFASVNDIAANRPKIILNITDKFVYNQPRGIGRGIVRGVL